MLFIEHTQYNNECHNTGETCTTSDEAIYKTCDVTDTTHACGVTEDNSDYDKKADCNDNPEIPPIADLIWLIVFSIVLLVGVCFVCSGFCYAVTQQSED